MLFALVKRSRLHRGRALFVPRKNPYAIATCSLKCAYCAHDRLFAMLAAVVNGHAGHAMHRTALTLLIAGVSVTLGGCTSYTAIEGSNYSVNTPLFRASIPVGDTTGPGQKRLRLAMAHQEATFSDGVEAGRTVDLNGTEIGGPTTLKGQTSITTADVGVILPIPIREQTVRGEVNVGGAMIDSTLKIATPTVAARFDDKRYGPSGGFALILNTADQRFGVRAGVNHTWAWHVNFTETELLGIFAPTQSVEFLLGYRNFDYEYREPGRSNINLTFGGPAAGIHVKF